MSKTLRLALASALALGGCTSSLPRFTTMADGPPPANSAPAAPSRSALAMVRVSVPKPEELMGQGPEALRRRMGEPSLLRKEGDAQVWQYAGTGCVVFLYLYDSPAGTPQVTFLDARAKSNGAVAVAPCLDDVVRTRAAAGIS